MPVPGYLTAISSGFFISLTGSLPLGNLNISALNISAQKGWKKGFSFAIGAALVELIYLVITIQLVSWIISHRSLFQLLQWVTVVVLVVLSYSSFTATHLDSSSRKFRNISSREWLYGIALSAMNPLQFPFWAGWVVLLNTQGYLAIHNAQYLAFALAAFAGTMTAFCLFIGAGHSLAPWLRKHRSRVNIALGCIFLGMALWQIFSMFKGHK